uniref:Kazal-like domain-containing protein n=1 Tax=Meloidogyne hapla TaxID=6305 RepID=A0A1I8C1V5_MELHA
MINFFKILGPICGFVIGAVVNKLYYTFPASAPRGLSPQDPTWIGAWWLGFLFIGFVMIGPSLMLFFFPEGGNKKDKKKSKNQHNGHDYYNKNNSKNNSKIYINNNLMNGGSQYNSIKINSNEFNGIKKKEKQKLALFDKHIEEKRGANGGEGLSLWEFLRSYGAVLNSRVYVGASIARVLDVLAFKGYMVFLPKFLENHYGIPQYQVHIYMAFFGVLGFAFGAASGGIGRDVSNQKNTELNLTRECNAECGCKSAKLYPVCDNVGNVYYSPCHAGCRHIEVLDGEENKLEFSECECATGGIVSKKLCPDNCKLMRYAFFVTIVLGAFIAGTGVVPGMLLLLRSVPPETRSPALGLQGLLVSAIGTLPSPFIWGLVIDSACRVWDYECQKTGACAIYDPWALRMRMHFLYIAIRALSLIADIYVCVHAKGLNLQEEEDDEGKNEEDRQSAEKAAAIRETITLEAIPT